MTCADIKTSQETPANRSVYVIETRNYIDHKEIKTHAGNKYAEHQKCIHVSLVMAAL